MKISLIVVADENNAIGYENKLLCHLPADLKYFKKLTTGHHILMGRKTFESIGKPLPERTNMVLTHDKNFSAEGIFIFHNVNSAINFAEKNNEENLFVIGGEKIFNGFINLALTIYLTRIHHKFPRADTYFRHCGLDPQSHELKFKKISSENFSADEKNKFDYSFEVWEK